MSPSNLRNVLLYAVVSISCLMATSSGQQSATIPDAGSTVPFAIAESTSEKGPGENTTTTSTTSTTTTTVAPDNTTTVPPPTPTPTPDNHNTTTVPPPTPTPDNHNTTTVPPPTPTPDNHNTTTTTSPTPITTTVAPPTPHCKRFDGYSFIGGVILAYGSIAIGLVLWKFYKARTERNYHTL